jgi:AcrR family transcriptional regulator
MSDAGALPEASEPGKREQNAIRNRAAILEAARMVFCEVGYGAATVRDIIRGTDLATGTFYNYFPDKESVLRVLIEEFQRELRRRVHEARAQATSLEEMLHSAFLCCFRVFVEDEVILELMLRIHDLTSATALEPAIRELAEDLREKSREGIIPPIDIDYLAQAIVAVAAELAFGMLRQKPADVDGATRFATELFLGGIECLSRKR